MVMYMHINTEKCCSFYTVIYITGYSNIMRDNHARFHTIRIIHKHAKQTYDTNAIYIIH